MISNLSADPPSCKLTLLAGDVGRDLARGLVREVAHILAVLDMQTHTQSRTDQKRNEDLHCLTSIIVGWSISQSQLAHSFPDRYSLHTAPLVLFRIPMFLHMVIKVRCESLG